eukprot:327644-Pleurochrysis_carterae.AAC.1
MSLRRDMLSPRRNAPPPACLHVPAPPCHDARRFDTSNVAGASNSNVPLQADARQHLNRQRGQREQQPLSRKRPLSVPSVARRGSRAALKFVQKPAIGVARAANKPWGPKEFSERVNNFLFCPAQSYRGRGFNGIAKPGLLPPHIAADRSQFAYLHHFLRELGFGNAGSTKWDAEFPLL